MILPIYLHGETVLRKKGLLIEQNDEIDSLISDMFETLVQSDGIGLAAHQVGKPYKLFVIKYNDTKNDEEVEQVFINLEIIDSSDEEDYFEEGCLSLPGISEEVKRPTSITVKYLDRDFNEHVEEYDGLLARVIQHENDHTDGMYFTDRLHPLRKKKVNAVMQNILKRNVNLRYKYK